MGKTKNIKIHKDPKTEDLYLKTEDFKNFIDLGKIKTYTLEPVNDDPNMALILTFYDEDGNVVPAKEV